MMMMMMMMMMIFHFERSICNEMVFGLILVDERLWTFQHLVTSSDVGKDEMNLTLERFAVRSSFQ